MQFAFNSCRLEAADRSLDSVVKLLRRHGTLRLRVTPAPATHHKSVGLKAGGKRLYA